MQKYQDLHTLLDKSPAAKSFFNTLPDYVRESICQRADYVNSMASLKDYAQNLLRGDG